MTLMHELTETYRPAASVQKERLMELIKEKAEAATKSELAKKLRPLKGFYTLEMAPPRMAEMDKLQADIALAKEFFKNKCYYYITVRQAWLLFLVCTEVFLWFFLGETIGKFHIVGYLV
ncbi:probable ATP synthase subunit g 1, mitochondrial isoform X2 [Helicoverpa armigera]